jgi:hypothetical protein
MSGTFSVKNFAKFQHYKDRSPPWIKLYNELLDDYAFGRLPDASKMHLIAIWLLASRYDNKIPADAEWIEKRINATSPVDLKLLLKAGFIEADQECSKMLADCKQVAMPETEKRERQRERDIEPPIPPKGEDSGFKNFCLSYPKRLGANPRKPAEQKYNAARKRGVSADLLNAAARAYAAEIRDAGKEGTEFVALMTTWLNQERWNDYAPKTNVLTDERRAELIRSLTA